MKIENLLANNTILAPMAGYTDNGFRSLCASYNCGLTVTEMVSAKALVMGNQATNKLLTVEENDKHCALQIFGHEPYVMAEAITLDNTKNFNLIDINMGCPVRKIVSNGEGSALLEDMPLASKIISKLASVDSNRLVSVKFRLGVSDSANAVEFAKMCADSGASMITVHFRTRKQMYMGQADYTLLPEICRAVDIPVIANGDIATREQYLHLTTQCGAYGVAVGRQALGKPFIFSQLQGIDYQCNLLETIEKHVAMLLTNRPDHVVCNDMKKHVSYYIRGLNGSKRLLVDINACKDTTSLLTLLKENNYGTYSFS